MNLREARAAWAALSPSQQADLGAALLQAANLHLAAETAAILNLDAAFVRQTEWTAERANYSLVEAARGALVLTAHVEDQPLALQAG